MYIFWVWVSVPFMILPVHLTIKYRGPARGQAQLSFPHVLWELWAFIFMRASFLCRWRLNAQLLYFQGGLRNQFPLGPRKLANLKAIKGDNKFHICGFFLCLNHLCDHYVATNGTTVLKNVVVTSLPFLLLSGAKDRGGSGKNASEIRTFNF